jgi:opacity protein-like surface antigen
MKKYFFAALLTMGLAAQAHAHLEKGDQILAVQGGVAVPVSQLEITCAYNSRDTFADPGGSIGGQYYYHVLPMLGVGLDVSNSKFNDRTSSSLIENTDSVSGGHSFDVLAVVRGAFIPNGRIHPFVEGGLGVSNTTLKVEATPVSSAVWGDTGTREKRTIVDSSQSGAALLIGGGADFFLTDHLFLGVDGRVMAYLNRTYEATPSAKSAGFTNIEGSLATFNILARLGLKF